MAIVGSLNDGLLHDPTTLYAKAALDGIAAVVFGATLGAGTLLSVIPVGIYQGLLTVGSSVIAPFVTAALLNNICMVGYTLVICIGLNIMNLTKIKVANLLPSMLIPILYAAILA